MNVSHQQTVSITVSIRKAPSNVRAHQAIQLTPTNVKVKKLIIIYDILET